jgi:hypothetical protein
MFEWRHLRSLAALLLCLPILHVTVLLAASLDRYLDPSPAVWDAALAEIIARDMQSSLPDDPIVVVGGQRVRLWTDLSRRLYPLPTLLRPLGDATLEDLSHHFDRLAAFYRPRVLIVFPGYADLHLRDAKSPKEFRSAASELLSIDESYGGSSLRILLVPLMTPLHPGDDARIREMARLAEALEGEHPRLVALDANGLLGTPDGRPDPAYFQLDGINLNRDGYARVALLIEEVLRREGLLTGESRQG